jgi:hypothetical protein
MVMYRVQVWYAGGQTLDLYVGVEDLAAAAWLLEGAPTVERYLVGDGFSEERRERFGFGAAFLKWGRQTKVDAVDTGGGGDELSDGR